MTSCSRFKTAVGGVAMLLLTVGIGGMDYFSLASDDAFIPPRSVSLPPTSFRFVAPIATLQPTATAESSGIIRSLQHEGVYWTHNDSGDAARIFAVGLDGSAVTPSGQLDPYPGIAISGATNVDWEDIARGPDDMLIISDLGNNENTRQDLAIYFVPEPDPLVDTTIPATKRIPVHYPEQTAFPPPDNNYDSEAVFWANGKVYVLTKHRADNLTRLYRLDSMREDDTTRSSGSEHSRR